MQMSKMVYPTPYPEYLDKFNAYLEAKKLFDNLFTASHQLAQDYVNDVEQLFGVTLTQPEINQLLGYNTLPNYIQVGFSKEKIIKSSTMAYESGLFKESTRLKNALNMAKANLHELQNTISIDYFRGDEHIFIQCEQPQAFRKIDNKIEHAFRQLNRVGSPKLWEMKIGVTVYYSAVSFKLDYEKLQMFYTCYYNWLFGAEFPNYMVGNNLMKQVDMFYDIDCWRLAEYIRQSSPVQFDDITDDYYYTL